MSHHHPACIARQALRRFRGNARPVLEHGLAWLIRVGQHLGIDVDHHLVPLSRGAGIEPVVQSRLREQGQGIRPLLGRRRGIGCRQILGRAGGLARRLLTPGLLVQGLAGC
jgi:hypothetical protein